MGNTSSLTIPATAKPGARSGLLTAIWCLSFPAFLSPISVAALSFWTSYKLHSTRGWHGGWQVYVMTGTFWWVALACAIPATLCMFYLAFSSRSVRQMKLSGLLATVFAYVSLGLSYYLYIKL